MMKHEQLVREPDPPGVPGGPGVTGVVDAADTSSSSACVFFEDMRPTGTVTIL
jgi:hypothetical protein